MTRPARLTAQALALALSLWSGPSAAVVFTVDSTGETGDPNPGDGVCASWRGGCTLRAAVMETNALAGEDTVELPAGTYQLTLAGANEDAGATGDLDVNGPLGLLGAGAPDTVIDAEGVGDSVLEVGPTGSLTLRGVTVTGGSIGVVAHGGLTVVESVITSNTYFGISGAFPAAITVVASTISDNGQGGILADKVAVIDSTLRGGTPALWGGPGPSDAALIVNSTIESDFGGVCTRDADIVFSTISGHQALCNGCGPPGSGFGCTLYRVRGTIIDGTCGSTSGLEDLGYNIESSRTCGFDHLNSRSLTDPLLGPLADNGGPTLTREPLQLSPAIDAVPVEDCTWDDDGDAGTPEVPLLFDQRGYTRPKGSGCDIGAVEVPEPAQMLMLLTGALVVAAAGRRTGRHPSTRHGG